MNEALRIGFGYDVHRLVKGKFLKLGGIEIPSVKRAEGHSDADVLIHALCDALLGALSLGDIGQHFPNTDSTYKNIDSTILLSEVMKMIAEKNYRVVNADTTVILEAPKIAEFIEGMKQKLSAVMKIDSDQISVKATTSEKLGFAGKGDGIAAQAVVLLCKKEA